jgi:hypothetical protein
VAIPWNMVLAARFVPLGSLSNKITSAPSSAAEMAAMSPAEEAPTTRTSQFTRRSGAGDEIKVSGGVLLVRLERKEERESKVHGHKTARTPKEPPENFISAIPSLGPQVARKLLKHFGSIEKVMAAPEEELREVALVGPKIAEQIREMVGGEYME